MLHELCDRDEAERCDAGRLTHDVDNIAPCQVQLIDVLAMVPIPVAAFGAHGADRAAG